MDCKSNPTSPLYGIWEVVEVSNGTNDIPYCEDLESGSKFIFACDSRLFVYRKGRENPCTTWKFGYAYKDSIIEMWEGDVFFGFEIDFFVDDDLKLSSHRSSWLLRREINALR